MILDEIKSMVNGCVIFENYIKVQQTPHTPVIRIYGVEKTKGGDIAVTVSEGTFLLNETDKNFTIIAASILQRLKSLKCKIQ